MELKVLINSKHTSERVYSIMGISPALQSNKGGTSNKSVLVIQKSTSMQSKSIKNTSEVTPIMATQQELFQNNSPNITHTQHQDKKYNLYAKCHNYSFPEVFTHLYLFRRSVFISILSL